MLDKSAQGPVVILFLPLHFFLPATVGQHTALVEIS